MLGFIGFSGRVHMRLRRALAAALVVAAAIPIAGVSSAAPDEPESVPGQLLVGYRRGTSEAQRAEARARADAVLVDRVVEQAGDRGAVELVAARGTTREESMRRFTSNPTVTFAEPNWVYTHDATSDDAYYTNGSLWGMYGDGTSPANQYGSQAGEAWTAGNTGSSTVYVGIIDEGVQYTHPDLDGNIWANPFDPADGVDNDGNGYVDDVRGWDFAGNDNTTYDSTGDDHGTHVAGTIGAEGGNGSGVAGVVWDVQLITAKFLGSGGGTTANAIKAVDYLTDLKTRHGLNIVATNNSWGGGGYSQGLYDAIQRANNASILFVAAAGNGGFDKIGDDNDSAPHYPSNYTNTNVISVASITSSGAKSSFSNYGDTSVDLGAPGSGVVSTVPGGYASYSGTSMATPHVTGAAALLATATPGASAAALKSSILGSTIPTSSMSGRTVTGGRLNLGTGDGGGGGGTTTTTTTTTSTTTTTTTTTTPPSGSTYTLTPSGVNNGSTWTARVTFTLSPAASGSVTGTFTGGASRSCATSTATPQCTVTLQGIPKKTASVTFTVTATSPTGYTGPTSVVVTKP